MDTNIYYNIFLTMDWYGKLQLSEIVIYFILLTIYIYKYLYKFMTKNLRIRDMKLFIVCLILILIFTFQNKNYIPAIFNWYLAGLEEVAKDTKLAWQSEFLYIINEHVTTLTGCILLSVCNFRKKFFD